MAGDDYCDRCNGYVTGRSRAVILLSWIAWHVWMRLPARLALGWAGMAILPWVGNIAFSCHCYGKNAARRVRRKRGDG